jgi:hypothetical protein
MNLKSKILAAGLAAIIAGGGIFALIAQLKSQETCGNGICRFGETAAACPADCNQPIADCAKEGEVFVNDYTCRSAKCGDNTCSTGEKCLRDCNVVDGKILIKVSYNGFAVGDIVSVKTASPQKNDAVYYNGVKNDNYCMAMGPGLSLGVIKGLPGQTVVFGDDYMKIGDETISTGDYTRRPAVFGGIKYDNLAGKTIILAQNEYLLDGWIGQQCFAGDETDQGSKPYARFTVNEDAIIAIIGAKVGHDSAYEKEMRRVIY